jgi:2-octaprenyl-6-methoxyphenol hydroxylase
MSPANRSASRPIVVLGGGPAGLATALALANSGLAVRLVDAVADPRTDRRTSALMVASVIMLEQLGIWAGCRDAAAPLKRLRIIDDTGRLVRAPAVEFDAAEIGEDAFGWNIPNSALVAAMRAACAESPAIDIIHGAVEMITPLAGHVALHLADGTEIATPLLVGADGRNSPSRTAAGIASSDWAYDQAALAVNLLHDRTHNNVSTEFHRRPGPFTLVPLPGNRSSLVWVERQRTARALASFAPAELASEIERLSHRLLGQIRIDGPVGVFPLAGLAARRFAARRVVLVGEAAHVMPPIGAQGLNLGLRDAATIAETAADAAQRGEDVGGRTVMDAYDRARRLDVMTRTGAVDLLNRTLLSDLVAIQTLRAAGLEALGQIGPLRRLFMREGVAPRLALPALMRREGRTIV